MDEDIPTRPSRHQLNANGADVAPVYEALRGTWKTLPSWEVVSKLRELFSIGQFNEGIAYYQQEVCEAVGETKSEEERINLASFDLLVRMGNGTPVSLITFLLGEGNKVVFFLLSSPNLQVELSDEYLVDLLLDGRVKVSERRFLVPA